MKRIAIALACAASMLTQAPAFAGPPKGGPVTDPGDPGGDPTDPGSDDPGDGSGGSTTPATPESVAVGSGQTLFNLDNLPTGPEGTEAFYGPGNQSGMTQTVDGLTLSLDTATPPAGSPSTTIRVDNDSENFGYLGVPAAVQVGIQASTSTGAAPSAVFANFSDAISYFSVDTYRLSGAFSFTVNLAAYSGLDGTGTLLGTSQGIIPASGVNYTSKVIELAGLAGARSVAILGSSGLPNYDDITATAGGLTSPAPEPATWMMMILGFGLVAGVMRRAYRKSEENFTRKVRSFATA